VWKAAEIAGITYREMLELLKTHNIPFTLSEQELRREIEEITGESNTNARQTNRNRVHKR